jgi:hypothetical protein
MELGPFSLVSTIEELLGRKSSGCVLENTEYGLGDPLRWPRDTLCHQKLALTSLTWGGRSVGIVRLRTMTAEFFLLSHVVYSVPKIWRYVCDLILIININNNDSRSDDINMAPKCHTADYMLLKSKQSDSTFGSCTCAHACTCLYPFLVNRCSEFQKNSSKHQVVLNNILKLNSTSQKTHGLHYKDRSFKILAGNIPCFLLLKITWNPKIHSVDKTQKF